MYINFVHSHTSGIRQDQFVTKRPLFHAQVRSDQEELGRFCCSRVNLFLSSFLLENLPPCYPVHHDHEQQPALQLLGSQPVNMRILFLAVPPRSNQRVQQQHLSSASRAWDLLFNFSSLAAFFPIFLPVTPKISENRIHAHIKDDWEFLLPSGTSCKKPLGFACTGIATPTQTNLQGRDIAQRESLSLQRKSSRQLP